MVIQYLVCVLSMNKELWTVWLKQHKKIQIYAYESQTTSFRESYEKLTLCVLGGSDSLFRMLQVLLIG